MIIPSGCRVLLRPFKIQEHDKVFAKAKAAGIVIAEFSERKEQVNVDKGTILSIGPKVSDEYVQDLKVGDVVGFAKFGGKFIEDPETEEVLLVVNDEDIICVIKEQE